MTSTQKYLKQITESETAYNLGTLQAWPFIPARIEAPEVKPSQEDLTRMASVAFSQMHWTPTDRHEAQMSFNSGFWQAWRAGGIVLAEHGLLKAAQEVR